MLVAAVCGWLVAASPTLAQERFLRFNKGRAVGEINVAKGQFMTAKTAANIGRVVVGNPEVANAVPMTSQTFYVLGKAEGRTNVAVYDAGDELLGTVNVEVGADTPDLADSIREVIPQANVRVETINGKLRLSGTVPDGVALRKTLEMAEQYGSEGVINALRVTGGQQVMLEVRFIEANRNAGRELGVSWYGRRLSQPPGRDGRTGGWLPRGDQENQDGVIRFNPLLPSGNSPFGTLIANFLGGGVSADVLVQALEEKGLARRLAEPNLIALSGEKASFLAGGEVPIPVAYDDKITVEYKEYGVRLNFTPVVLENGLINLKLEPEVSQVDPSVRLDLGAISIPSFITRRASTSIEIRDGQSFAIAGLLQTSHTKNQEQIPWIGQLPIIGALFRSSGFQEQETDLVIIVTPRLVKPAKPGQPLRTPLDGTKPSNDVEFFLMGSLEVDSGMQKRFAEGAGVVGPYGHIVELQPEKRNVGKKISRKY
ncbi:type II and III secretion system protein family protein [Microvirga arsenatis]|uniref:BON domain-containing protein n=1 Tax=Microvirga arsenatis TaxID=2692265 RepID=A0ABW9YWW3_9HYPH|nr:type II and III secretion system protein family protein [Microvirga arsenatis]NBJ10563.1 BON domain-containing protein [Microvirga arsenatis]NBJ24538.1 BON domain-containing protein [Microvirga arsenatis]